MASLVRRCMMPYGCCLAALLALAALASPGRLGAAAAAEGSGVKWHVVSVSSLLPSAACTATAAAPNSSALRVVHRHGPCSPLRSRGGPPSHAEIMGRDQERLHAMHRRVPKGANVTLQARWGKPLGTSNYYISVGLGTPARDLSVEFDTGSSQSWVQCKPCADCYEQHDPLFDPSKSATYSTVSCAAKECREFGSQNCSSGNNCRYEVSYADKSRTTGTLARDTLRLTPATTVRGFMFGCGHNDAGVFGEVDGLFGLGRGKASLSSQAAVVYGDAGFSYCLPSSSSTVGYLTFGGAAAAPANAQFTAMVSGQDDGSWYYLNLTGIKVGGKAIKAPSAAFATASGTIIDSGTAFSRLPPRAYAALRSAFRRAMAKHGYRRAPASPPFDTCYDLSGHEVVRVPSVVLVFADRTAVALDPSGVLYAWDEASQAACLAFAPNTDETYLGVLGNVQQRTLAVVYDVGNRRVGFGAKGCA
ncbi:aspartyl protease family protein At5g10770 [Setaria italica]|uniref:Peptidase A1 domain-containing protein n=2 Tax=Setaria italica TaxID=4555 RepID=K4A1G0_SETIT|nr:aspartyl protease family protein At5g10770 [Setaria italica]